MKADRALVLAYTEAFFEAALKAGVADEIAEQVGILDGMVQRDEQNRWKETKLRSFMEAPNISRDAKEDLFVKALGGKFNPLLVNFVRLLIRRGRLELFVPALAEFQVFHRRHLGITPAIVITAVPLRNEDKRRMEAALNAFTGKKLVVDYRVHPSVIGGAVFECGDMLIDGSISDDLERLQHRLTASRLH